MKNILSKIKIDYSTYILMLIAMISGYIKNVFIILIIVLVHELGHVFFFCLYKIDIESIVIYPFGGVGKVNKKIHERIYKDIFISLGGILFQLVLFIIFYILYKKDLIVFSTYTFFNEVNKSIIAFNLLPIIPLDGSKLLYSISTKFISVRSSYVTMIIIGLVSLICFIMYNFIFRINDILIYLFLLCNLVNVIKEYKYYMNKFYLERVIDDHYYDEIISGCNNINRMRIDKFYYFKRGNKYINEKKYLNDYYG